MGRLFKELFQALGRFIAYRFATILHGPEVPAAAVVQNGESHAVEPPAPGSPALEPLPAIGLDARYEQSIDWPAHRSNVPPAELLSDPLYELWSTIPEGHKWTHYFGVYAKVFAQQRAKPLRILEIGVLRGSSLRMWKRYFSHVDTLIVGLDIDPACAAFDASAEGIHVRIGSQTDQEFLRSVVREFGPFDIIIDDGSHHSSHIITSFNHLFADGLKDTGIYFVEDLHANYWLPWRDSAQSFLDVCKELIEHMHAHYREAGPTAFFIGKASDQTFESLSVPVITTMIEEIRIFDSIVAIQKTRRNYVPYYLRLDAQP